MQTHKVRSFISKWDVGVSFVMLKLMLFMVLVYELQKNRFTIIKSIFRGCQFFGMNVIK